MADIIKEIQTLNTEISALKTAIEKYDKQISASESTAKKLESYFSSAKLANAGRIEIAGLERAVSSLTERYDALTKAQDNYRDKQRALTEQRAKEEELVRRLADAQRQALTNGDQAGASNLYNQYVAANKAIAELDAQQNALQASLNEVNVQVNQTTAALTRYETVLQAVKGANGVSSIEALTNAFNEQERDMIEITKEMQNCVKNIGILQKRIADNKVTPEDLPSKLKEIETLKYHLTDLGTRYQETAMRARDLATAMGKNPDDISLEPNVDMSHIDMPKVEKEDVENVKKAAENMKEFKDEGKNATDQIKELKNDLAKLGGLGFGLNKLKQLGAQIMNTRGESQQLEVAFTTMLGSKEKADSLMQQLTKTAATTPFDLQSVSNGAKQLLAYGTAAEDVNDILVHLGDISAGLSQPLDALVYLYGTTMTQGKMMTRDLRQFQNRGIPIAEQLAKQFGVAKSEVESLVSAGRVTSEEFHKAVMGMASDGGKFAGLMNAQSKTISGQISNIEDSISMMFNEIGKSSEGVINLGLSGVSKLIENYESVGKTIIGLVAAYGTYKTALIITTALEAAKAKQARFALLNNGKQISLVKALTNATYKQIVAQLKSNAAALANPYVLVAAALAALVFVIINWNKWMEKSVNVTAKVNKKYEESVSKINDETAACEEHIAILEDETSAYYDVLKAKDALNKSEAFKGVNTAGMTPEQMREHLDKWQAEQLQKAKEEEDKGLEQSITRGRLNWDWMNSEKKQKAILESTSGAVQQLTADDFEEFSKDKSIEEQEKYLNENIDKQRELIAKYEAMRKEYEDTKVMQRSNKYGEMHKSDYADWQYEIELAKLYIANYQQMQATIDDAKEKAEKKSIEDNKGNSLAQIIYGYDATNDKGEKTFMNGIVQQEKVVEQARAAYAKNSSAANKLAIEKAEASLKDLTDKYKMATGENWTASKEFIKNREKEERAAARKMTDITLQEYSKRVQIAEKYNRDVEDLELQIAEWKEKNQGRALPDYFSKQRAVIDAQFEFDKAQLDKEFNEWVQEIENEVYNIHFEIDTAELDEAIENATTFAEKRILQDAKFEREQTRKEQELDKDIEKEAKDKYGDETIAAYNQFKQGDSTKKWSEAEKATFEEMDKFYQTQATKRNAILEQMEQQHNSAMLQEDLQNFEQYTEGVLQAEEQYQNELAAIRERYGLSANADVENSTNANIKADVAAAQTERDRATKSIEKETGLESHLYVERLVGLGEEIGNKTKDEIRALYDMLITELDAEIDALKKAETTTIANAQANIDANQARMAYIDDAVAGGGLSDVEKGALLAERARLEGEIATYQQQQADATARLNDNQGKIGQLVAVRNRAEQIGAQQVAKAEGAGEKAARLQQRRLQASVEALSSVKEIANEVANTFGGALSKKAKKALNAMSGIADFGISAIQGIETLVKGVSDGMIATTAGASSSMQALEKASFILTVISIAVQLISKIVEIASQFTKSAQLQDSIDEHLKKVDELQLKQDQLQRDYQKKTGIDYYKGMTKAAKQYSAILAEQNKALREATELYELNRRKYGEDSDKTEEAREQMNDLKSEYQNTADEQAEMFKEVAAELATTDLQSFSQSLAESIVEGFENGTEGIEDVFDDVLDDLYRSMLTKQLAMALEKQFEPIFKRIEERANDGNSLTQTDIDSIMQDMENAKDNAKSLADAYYDVFSQAGLLDDADAEGSQGFGQMTQDQADTLTARFTAVQIEMSNVSAATQVMAGVVSGIGEDIKLGLTSIQNLLYNSNVALQMQQEQLDQLQVIADNTAMLAETNNRLRVIEQNTGRL